MGLVVSCFNGKPRSKSVRSAGSRPGPAKPLAIDTKVASALEDAMPLGEPKSARGRAYNTVVPVRQPIIQPSYNFTGSVKPNGPPDTSHGLFDVYPGSLKGRMATLMVARRVGNGANAPEVQRLMTAIQQRLEREINVWMMVPRPFVPYIGFATVDGAPAALTESVEGTTAKEYLNGKSIENKRRLIVECARALASLHSYGLSHGSIVPQCFLVDKNGETKVAGFGFPRMVEEELAKTNLPDDYRPSARYTAPEIVADEQANLRSDVYSFALVALELMTGKQPFASIVHEAALLPRIIQGVEADKDYNEPQNDLQNDPAWILFKNCLKRDPSLRPSMDEVSRELSAAWNI